MAPIFSLAHLTFAPLSPPEAIELAARLGYGAVGVRLLPAAPGGDWSPLIEDAALLARTRAAIAATGVGVFDVEIVRIGPDFTVERVRRFLEVAAAIDAKAILVAGDDPDERRLTASYAAFCEAAAPLGLTADLEFMPWTAVPNAAAAARVVEASGAENGGVLVDALHFARSATSFADVAALPRRRLHYAQLCDASAVVPATVEGLVHDARKARLLPGEGGIDLVGLLRALPADLPISLEIPNDARQTALGVETWARLAIEHGRAIVAAARGAEPRPI